MTGSLQPYCVATVIKQVDPEQIEEVTVLHTFDDVVAHLRRTYDWFADVIADIRSENETSEPTVPIGGFGVQLRNRWGGEVEVGVGRAIWFLFRSEPSPGKCISDNPELSGSLVFYLDGWHYTELERHRLVSKGTCLITLRHWLDSGKM
jgi:hypothetical protein